LTRNPAGEDVIFRVTAQSDGAPVRRRFGLERGRKTEEFGTFFGRGGRMQIFLG
jgi:hypothetical protein